MITVIERVTCDKCGEVREFEKFNNGTLTTRVESLPSWLAALGWQISYQGLRTSDICPNCRPKL